MRKKHPRRKKSKRLSPCSNRSPIKSQKPKALTTIWFSTHYLPALKTWTPRCFNKFCCSNSSHRATSSKWKKQLRNGHKPRQFDKPLMASLLNKLRPPSLVNSRREIDPRCHSPNAVAARRRKLLFHMKNPKSQSLMKSTWTSWMRNNCKSYYNSSNNSCSSKLNAKGLHQLKGRSRRL